MERCIAGREEMADKTGEKASCRKWGKWRTRLGKGALQDETKLADEVGVRRIAMTSEYSGQD